jgi:hypothetical protein
VPAEFDSSPPYRQPRRRVGCQLHREMRRKMQRERHRRALNRTQGLRIDLDVARTSFMKSSTKGLNVLFLTVIIVTDIGFIPISIGRAFSAHCLALH